MASPSEFIMFAPHQLEALPTFEGAKDEAWQFYFIYDTIFMKGKTLSKRAENLAACLRGEAFRFY